MAMRTVRALSALVITISITAGSGTAIAAQAQAHDLRTPQGRAAYLVDRGFDPAQTIVQVGPRLYAGKGCLAGFQCIDPAGKPVFQVATATPAGGPGIAIAKCGAGCAIAQAVPAGDPPTDLTAECTYGTQAARLYVEAAHSSIVRTCQISQDNPSGGNNTATATIATEQRSTKIGGSGHDVDQDLLATVDIDQDAAGPGKNTATVVVDAIQKAYAGSITGTVIHRQDAVISTGLTQDGQGDNAAKITHLIEEKSDAFSSINGPITQRQNAEDDGGPDSFAFVRQNSTSGNSAVGFNDLTLTMNETLKSDAKTGSHKITAIQGSPGGGLVGDIDGDADGVPSAPGAPGSAYSATMSKTFKQDVKGGSNNLIIQDDIIDCCDVPHGFSRSYDYCTLDFDALLAQSPLSVQDLEMRGTAEVDGNCNASFDGATGSDSFSHTESGKRIVFDAECVNGGPCQTNEAPDAADVSASGAEDTTIVWHPVVGDPEGGALSCQAWTEDEPTAQHGTVAVDPNCGASTYTPDPDFAGTDTFLYVARDDGGLFSRRATVAITVTPVNDAPVANDDAATTDEDVPVTIDVTANDTDVDGTIDDASVSITSAPSSGSAVANGNGTVTYAPAPDTSGQDSFAYQVCDDDGACDTATVTVTVNAVNDAPVATDDAATTDEDVPVTIDVTANDTDSDGTIDDASVSIAGAPSSGSAVPNGDGTVTYTPAANTFGSDSFSYTVCDDGGACDTATVTVTVHAVNDAPVAADDAATTDEEVSTIIDVAANDTDIDGALDLSSVEVVDGPDHGTATVNGNGSITYSPVVDFYGTDTFVYEICDDGGLCDTATVTVTVNNVPEPPESSIALGVRNASSTGPYGTSAAVGLAPDNRAQYRISYTNAGEVAASSVLLRHPIPNQASLVSGSCSVTCAVVGNEVHLFLGAGAPGTTHVTFTLAFGVTFQNATTNAQGSSLEEGAFAPSNSVTVHNLCVTTPNAPICDPF